MPHLAVRDQMMFSCSQMFKKIKSKFVSKKVQCVLNRAKSIFYHKNMLSAKKKLTQNSNI